MPDKPPPPKPPAPREGSRPSFATGGVLFVALAGCFLVLGIGICLALFSGVFRPHEVARTVTGNASAGSPGRSLPAARSAAHGQTDEPSPAGTPLEEAAWTADPDPSAPAVGQPLPVDATTAPASPAPTLAVATPPAALPGEVAAPGVAPAASPPRLAPTADRFAAPATAPDGLALVRKDPEEERKVRQEVLLRIDLLKELTPAEKDHLYSQVQRARGFTKLAIVPFSRGRTSPEAVQVAHLLSYLRRPEFQSLFEDPTVVLVFAGYADLQGSEAQNLELSHRRAENMVRIFKSQAKLENLMRAVGMGGSDLFDKQDPGKNRVVEIWLVQP